VSVDKSSKKAVLTKSVAYLYLEALDCAMSGKQEAEAFEEVVESTKETVLFLLDHQIRSYSGRAITKMKNSMLHAKCLHFLSLHMADIFSLLPQLSYVRPPLAVHVMSPLYLPPRLPPLSGR
jgi:hypothetical protein